MEDKDKAAMPEEVTDEQRTDETAESAAEPGETGREAEREGSKEAGEANEPGEEASEPASGEDPVAKEGDLEEETEEPEEDPKPEKEEKKSKGIGFRSKKELQKKEEEIASLKDQLLRSRAEFDNFRKRTDREKAVRFDDGAVYILQKLLPVIDNFERGIAQVPEEAKEDPYVTGMEMIYKQFMTMLTDSGVTPIEAVGAEFDPNCHNAVMHVDDESVGDNIVVEEFQKGYRYKDQVLRHSMVKVAN